MSIPWGRWDKEIQEMPGGCKLSPRLSGLGDSTGPSYTPITWQ